MYEVCVRVSTVVYVCFAIGAVIIVLGVALIVFFVIRHRSALQLQHVCCHVLHAKLIYYYYYYYQCTD